MAQKYLGSFQILQSYSIKRLRGVESKQTTQGRQNAQSCLQLFHVLVAPQVAAVQMAQVCTAGSICLFGGKAVTPLLTGSAEAMLLSVAQKYRQIEGQLINLLATSASHSPLQFLPSFPTPHRHTRGKRCSLTTLTLVLLSTLLSPKR